MGASGWAHRVPYAGSVEATLIALQEQVLDSGEFIWPWDDTDPSTIDPKYADLFVIDERADVPRPSSLVDLNAAKETDEFWDEGTHTILDIDRVVAPDDDDQAGAIRPLTPAELSQAFGTTEPSAADFDRACQSGRVGPVSGLPAERWTGRSVLIYADGVPAEIYFWGFSGD